MTCNFCNKKIERHGNARYCPEKNGIKDYCYKEEKKMRQKALIKAKIAKAKMENLLTGTLEGILQGDQVAHINNLNYLEVYFKDGLFEEYILNKHKVFKYKCFQISKVEDEDNKPIYEIKKINDQHEFKI